MAKTEVIKARSGKSDLPHKLLRVAAYCRVSTDQEEQRTSYDSQCKYYREKIRQNPAWVLADIYADDGITGTSFAKRKEFQRMIADCLSGKIDMVITKSLSRFSRNTEDTIKYVRMLRDKAIPVIFEEEHINTCSMDGELMLTILGAVYQQEVENTSSHVRLGKKMAMKRGEMVSGGRVYGYDYHKDDKTLSINEEQAKVVRRIFAEYVSGYGGAKISQGLNAEGIKSPMGTYWNAGVVLNILKNVKYKGDLLQGRTYVNDPIRKKLVNNYGEREMYYVSGHHEAIIEPELFDKAQQTLKQRRERYNVAALTGKHREFGKKHEFTGKLYCGQCGRAFTLRKQEKGRKAQSALRWRCCGKPSAIRGCSNNKEWSTECIQNAFVASFNHLCRTGESSLDAFLDVMKTVLRKKERERDQIKKLAQSKLRRLTDQIDILLSQKLDGYIGDKAYQVRYEALREELQRTREAAEKIGEHAAKRKKLEARIKAMQERLRQYGPLDEFDAKIFEAVIERVILGEPKGDDGEYITFIYRDGEMNCFDMREFQRTVELKRQMNMASAHHKGKETVPDVGTYQSLDKHGNGVCTTHSVRSSLMGNMVTLGSSVSDYGIMTLSRLDEQGVKDCTTLSVNKSLQHNLATELKSDGILNSVGLSGDGDIERTKCTTLSVKIPFNDSLSTSMIYVPEEGKIWQSTVKNQDEKFCTMHSVNRSAHRAMFDRNYGQHGGAPL